MKTDFPLKLLNKVEYTEYGMLGHGKIEYARLWYVGP